ncbi:hypothetical protein ACFSHT_18265 [Paraburkholderia silviterrae]|uniref:Uncharacterized protein n=1 Tax=Paraburkholderia silviterrae TaxID=2528715 RepID=A0A4R5M9B3_9BURK|nr:hypothetical protein [Paraburkholderia silviterrae]TDG22804.1 hypothetical protein EYW47_16450 [Paraburkholderia silviterrae]
MRKDDFLILGVNPDLIRSQFEAAWFSISRYMQHGATQEVADRAAQIALSHWSAGVPVNKLASEFLTDVDNLCGSSERRFLAASTSSLSFGVDPSDDSFFQLAFVTRFIDQLYRVIAVIEPETFFSTTPASLPKPFRPFSCSAWCFLHLIRVSHCAQLFSLRNQR